MENNDRRLTELEGKLKAELGDDHTKGQEWRVLESHAGRLHHMDAVIWQGGDSVQAQILKLRTEIRTIAIVLGVAIPAVLKFFEWFAK